MGIQLDNHFGEMKLSLNTAGSKHLYLQQVAPIAAELFRYLPDHRQLRHFKEQTILLLYSTVKEPLGQKPFRLNEKMPGACKIPGIECFNLSFVSEGLMPSLE